jgi:hypothetical protein
MYPPNVGGSDYRKAKGKAQRAKRKSFVIGHLSLVIGQKSCEHLSFAIWLSQEPPRRSEMNNEKWQMTNGK